MTGILARYLLLSIPTWLAVTLILDFVGDARLTTAVFFTGGCIVMTPGLLFLARNRRRGLAVRPLIVYSLISLFIIGAVLFSFSYFVGEASILFYLALIVLIVGTCGAYLGVRRTPSSNWRILTSRTGYSIKRIRLWGTLIGSGFSLGFASAVLVAWGIQLPYLTILVALGFGLGVGSGLGLWLELTKPKR